MTGIPDKQMPQLINVLRQYQNVEKAAFFGSRAMGNARRGSDVDIALFGKSITDDDVWRIHDQLEEGTTLPYFFDVLHYETLNDVEIKAHINRVALEFYDRTHFTPLPKLDPLLY